MATGQTGDVADAWSRGRVIDARNATAALLHALHLEGYLFEVEPRANDVWEIRLEWVRGGPGGIWTSTCFEIDGRSLLRSRDDDATRARILRAWQDQVEASLPS